MPRIAPVMTARAVNSRITVSGAMKGSTLRLLMGIGGGRTSVRLFGLGA